MIRALIAALAFAPTFAEACVILPPACSDDVAEIRYESVSLSLAEKADLTTSVFVSAGGALPANLYLVECVSGRGVEIRDINGETPAREDEAVGYLVEAALSDKSYPLREIREHLRQMGLETRMVDWPANHCACALQTQPIIGCPAGTD